MYIYIYIYPFLVLSLVLALNIHMLVFARFADVLSKTYLLFKVQKKLS